MLSWEKYLKCFAFKTNYFLMSANSKSILPDGHYGQNPRTLVTTNIWNADNAAF